MNKALGLLLTASTLLISNVSFAGSEIAAPLHHQHRFSLPSRASLALNETTSGSDYLRGVKAVQPFNNVNLFFSLSGFKRNTLIR